MSHEHTSPFEQIREHDEQGREYWSARALGQVLGYQTNYRNFKAAIEKARAAMQQLGVDPNDHIADVRNMITVGKGAKRKVEDYKLSRYACYMVVQSADAAKKPAVALGQSYFATQTRRQELGDQLDKELLRIDYYDKLIASNNLLRYQASWAGIIEPQDFAIFQDHGYRGLYGGEVAADIQSRKGLKPNQHIEDWMGTTEIAANAFNATQTANALRNQQITDKDGAHNTAYRVGQAIRKTIADLGNDMPETLPTPAENIHQLRARKLTEPALPEPLAQSTDAGTADPAGEDKD